MRPFTTKLARLIGREDFDAAIAEMRAGLKGDASDLAYLKMIAHCHQWAGRQNEAIAVCRDALKLDPNSFEIHSMLATMLSKSGQYSDAAQHARKGLECYPEPLPAIPGFIIWLLGFLSRFSARLRETKPDEALKDIEMRRAEWYRWAKQYLEWYDATFGRNETPLEH